MLLFCLFGQNHKIVRITYVLCDCIPCIMVHDWWIITLSYLILSAMIIIIIFRENKTLHSMWIVDSHGMQSLIFSESTIHMKFKVLFSLNYKKKIQNVVCCSCVISPLRVKPPADCSHEMTSIIFSEKYNKINSSAADVISALTINPPFCMSEIMSTEINIL